MLKSRFKGFQIMICHVPPIEALRYLKINKTHNFIKNILKKLEDYCECPDIPKCSESEPHMIRVGWSVAESSTQLGENKYSFAYCNSGKKCTESVFEDYGETFEKGDSVASYVVSLTIIILTNILQYMYIISAKNRNDC